VRPHLADSDPDSRPEHAPLADDFSDDSLAEAVARRIENATCGRVNGLFVARLGTSLVLHGYCRTYRARELAHQAAVDLADGEVELIDLLTVS
jgi:hypothetical protein